MKRLGPTPTSTATRLSLRQCLTSHVLRTVRFQSEAPKIASWPMSFSISVLDDMGICIDLVDGLVAASFRHEGIADGR